jgi:hypothetical protein
MVCGMLQSLCHAEYLINQTECLPASISDRHTKHWTVLRQTRRPRTPGLPLALVHPGLCLVLPYIKLLDTTSS